MAYENPVKKGRYTARPVEWRYNEIGQNKTPVLEVKFRFEEDGAFRSLTWKGFLTEKARKKTLEQLTHCGFRDKDLSRFVKGVVGKALDVNQEVDVAVDHSEHEGKTYANITWVNPVGGAKFKNSMNEMEAEQKAMSIDIQGDMMAVMEKLGIEATVEEDDIGF